MNKLWNSCSFFLIDKVNTNLYDQIVVYYYFLFFLILIKFLTKITIEKREVPTIIRTLINPIPPVSIDLGSLVPIRDNKITKVKTIATCEKILFSLWFLEEIKKHAKSNTPNIEGISAVGEDTSKNPHSPIRIREIEFIMLALDEFIKTPILFVNLY